MSTVKPDRIRSRLDELEQAVETLSLRVRQLQGELAAPLGPASRRARWSAWLEGLVGRQPRGDYVQARVRENRRVHRHAIHARRQSGL